MKKAVDVVPGGVEEYIAGCPKEVQSKLEEIRAIIKEAAPGAKETVSYFQMPGYYYEGYDYNGMFAWFSYKKPFIRLHVRPPVIKDHKEELKGYATTVAVVSFPEKDEIKRALIKKLVVACLTVMKGKYGS